MRRPATIAGTATTAVLLLTTPAFADNWHPVRDKDVAPASLGNPCYVAGTSGWGPNDSINVQVVTNNREEITSTSNGVKTTTSRGKLVLEFIHVDQNGNVVAEVTRRDVSGDTTQTIDAKKNGTFQGTGANWLSFGPTGRKLTGEPGLIFTYGPVTVTFFGNVAAKVVTGAGTTVENGCQLLAAP